MGKYTTISAEIATILKTVSGIGQVHETLRHTVNWEDFLTRHVKNGRVDNWEITRVSSVQTIRAVQNKTANEPFFFDTHQISIRGAFGLKDVKETEKTFNDVVDLIVTEFRKKNLLNGKVDLPRQPQVVTIDHRMFGGILVHFAEITLEAVEFVGG